VRVISAIGVGARKYLGVRRIFARIFSNLPEKFGPLFVRIFSHEDRFWNRKNFSCDSAHVGGHFFQTEARWTPFCGICREFAQSFRGFAKVFTDFAQISADFADFQEFCPNFHHIKTFGGALAPSPPFTTDISKPTVIARSKSVNLN